VDLPAFIIRRLPVRLTYDNNYFNDTYQGIPIGGYTQIVKKMLDHENIDVEVNVDFFANKDKYLEEFPKIVFTGMIDEFFDYKLGELEYRSLRFETETLDTENYQGNAVVNYTDSETPYTRVIEHKHFEFGKQDKTIITREYSKTWKKGDEPYYPVNNSKNNALYAQYRKLADEQEKIIFGGRLGQYRYYDMHQVIAAALQCVRNEVKDN
jgi:UDP-galactopyranose mutase